MFDTLGPHSRQNLCFDPSVAKEKWYHHCASYFYEECQKKGIQLITTDIYFALSEKPKAICMRERIDIDMSTSLALQKSGVRLAVIRNSENPLYACRFFWNLKKLTSYFDHSVVVKGVRDWVSPKSQFHPWFIPHAYYNQIHEVQSDFHKKKFLVLIQRNARIHWLRRLYVSGMNFIKPLPNFVNQEGYLNRLKAIKYFSQYSDFDLYGMWWDKPVRYTHKYDEAIQKSYRGAVEDKFALLKQYKFSLIFDNAYLGGMVHEKMTDCLYAGSVPIYWGAPDIADIFPDNCFINFRKFGCDFARLNEYIRSIDENTYNDYIKNINKFISSPAAYNLSQEKYASDMIKIFESYF